MGEVFKELFLPIVVICIIAIGGPIALVKHDCSVYADITGRETKSNLFTCYVKDSNGDWYTYEEQKFRNATKGE